MFVIVWFRPLLVSLRLLMSTHRHSKLYDLNISSNLSFTLLLFYQISNVLVFVLLFFVWWCLLNTIICQSEFEMFVLLFCWSSVFCFFVCSTATSFQARYRTAVLESTIDRERSHRAGVLIEYTSLLRPITSVSVLCLCICTFFFGATWMATY